MRLFWLFYQPVMVDYLEWKVLQLWHSHQIIKLVLLISYNNISGLLLLPTLLLFAICKALVCKIIDLFYLWFFPFETLPWFLIAYCQLFIIIHIRIQLVLYIIDIFLVFDKRQIIWCLCIRHIKYFIWESNVFLFQIK